MRCRGWIHTVALSLGFWSGIGPVTIPRPRRLDLQKQTSEASIRSGGDPVVAPAAPSLLEVCRRVRSIEISICPMILKWLSNFQIDATGVGRILQGFP
jgi:hypothetical protein